jgi:lysophospholipase L1-like esterase
MPYVPYFPSDWAYDALTTVMMNEGSLGHIETGIATAQATAEGKADAGHTHTASNVTDFADTSRALNAGVHANLYNFTADKFRKWNKAKAKVALGTADAKILCVGDSNTAGYGTTGSGRTSLNAWPAVLARSIGTSAYEGMIVPQVNGVILNNKVVFAGTWNAPAGSAGLGWASTASIKGYWYCAENNATMTFTPGFTCDSFDVYYFATTTTGTATVQATGGSSSNIVAGGTAFTTAPISKMTVTAGSLSDSNTLVITKTGTTAIYIFGVEAFNSTARKIRVANAGMASTTCSNWSATGASTNATPAKSIQAYAPDLTIIDLGTNDANVPQTPSATYITALQTVITAAQVSGDVIIKTMHPYGVADATKAALIEEYVAAIKTLGVPVIDAHARHGAYAAYNTAGFMFDTLHGNDYSHQEIAAWVHEALRVV